MKSVLFVPDWRANNPYQTLLMDQIKNSGVDVNIDNYSIKWPVLFNTLRKNSNCSVLHLHWIDPYIKWFYWTDSRIMRYIKFVLFVLDLCLVKLSGKKIVWTLHNLYMHESVNQKRELLIRKILFKFANAVFLHSESVVDKVERIYNIKSSNKVHIIEHANFIDIYENSISKNKARSILGIDPQKRVYLYLGAIRPYKGIKDLIKAFKSNGNDENAQLILAGKPIDDKFGQEIKDLIKDEPQIKAYFEFIDDNRIQDYMNAADICVFPFSQILTSGSVILAMSFKKAVIVPKKGCLVDILDDKRAIFFDDIKELGSSMAKSRNMDTEKMGQDNFDYINQYTWKGMGYRLTEIYKSL